MTTGVMIRIAAAGLAAGLLAGCGDLNPVTSPTQPAPGSPLTPGVARAQPAELRFLVQPTATRVGALIDPPVQVAVLDSLGRIDTATVTDVTLTIKPYTVGALRGPTTVTTVHGVATFGGLTVWVAAPSWSLMAVAPGRHWVKSYSFAVSGDSVPAAPTH